MMTTTFNERTWLEWLVKVRIIVITLLLGIGLVIMRFTRNDIEPRFFISVIVLWYTVAVFLLLLQAIWGESRLQARVQVLTDLAFSSALIYVSGGIDTSFNFLYPLVIIIASILLPRWWAYLTAALSFIAFGAMLELSYFEVIRSFQMTRPDLKSLQAVILINLLAYMSIAYLASNLSQKLRQVDVQLQDKSGALEDLQALHENIVHSVRSGIITADLEGRITLLNLTAQRLLERRAQDVLSHNVTEYFGDGLPVASSGIANGEVSLATPSGLDKTFGLTATPLRKLDGSIVGQIYTFNDLTDIKRLEREVRLRDRMSAVGRLAAGIAHEIRNPLASIAGSVQVLAGISALNEEQRTLVNIVTSESERLNHIISDFLVYSRETKLEFTESDLVRLLDETLTLLNNRQPQGTGTILIERDFPSGQAPAIVDADRMKQVFWNICENAVRAMREGGTLHAGVRRNANEWEIAISDTGRGMTSAQIEKIFEPFQSSFVGGTGLGLAIVYQILQAHNAHVSVQSQPGKGTCFTLRVAAASTAPSATPYTALAGGARA